MRARAILGSLGSGRFARDEDGAAMVEFSIVASVFFYAFFVIMDFGLFTSSNLLAEKSVQVAARIATVRPAACAGVPERHVIGTLSPAPRYGTSCRAAANVCAVAATVSCAGDASDATASEIWSRIEAVVPTAEISDLTFTYSSDPDLGYLGGPYTPMVTVDLTLPDYGFLLPLGALVGDSTPTSIGYRVISISLPGEDLAAGTDG